MSQAGVERDWNGRLADQISEHGRLFFRLAHGVLRDAQAAEDACQQALLKAMQRRQDLENPAALRSWLAKVVLNESLHVARRRRTEKRVLAQHQGPTPSEAGPQEMTLLRQSVLEAMLHLPEQVRLIVALRLMEGMRGNEVKELLGCSASEVSRQLHQGMEQLRVLLADWNAV